MSALLEVQKKMCILLKWFQFKISSVLCGPRKWVLRKQSEYNVNGPVKIGHVGTQNLITFPKYLEP